MKLTKKGSDWLSTIISKPFLIGSKRKDFSKLTFLDFLAYKIFYSRWEPVLKNRPDLCNLFKDNLQGWSDKQAEQIFKKSHLSVVVDNTKNKPNPLKNKVSP